MQTLLDIAIASLRDLVHNARLLKQCPDYDGCDICKAERVIKHYEGDVRC